MSEFGRELRSAREHAHLTQRELATRAGVDAAHVLRLERGDRGATREVVEALADAMTLDGYERALLLTAAGFVPLVDAAYRQLVATIAQFWARQPDLVVTP